MSTSIYRDRWRRPGRRARAVPPALTLTQQLALAIATLQGALVTVQGLWEDAPVQYAAGNLDVVNASMWSAAFAAEAAVIEGTFDALAGGR
ncbi:MAG: hypothetical protein ACREFQ_13710 [Stellaceae bacterium]